MTLPPATATALFYAAMFFAMGVHLPFWPVLLEDRGIDAATIADLTGAAIAARIATGLIVPALGDRLGLRRALLSAMLLAGAGLSALHLVLDAPVWLIGASIALAAAMGPMLPLGEALGLRAATRHGFAYASVRAVGSAAFLAANLALGALIGSSGAESIAWGLAGALLAAGLLAPFHPGGGAPPGAGAGTERDRGRLGEALALARNPAIAAFAVAAAVGQASHAVYYVYGSIDWERQGIAPATIGALWAFGVAVEIWLMLGPGQRLVTRIGAGWAMAGGALAGILRWGAMAAEPAAWLLWPLQALHALTFALAHLGAMAFVAAMVPYRLQGSAQGLVAALSGACMALASFAAARVAGDAETDPLAPAYLLAAGMAAVSLAAAVAMARLRPDGEPGTPR